MKTLMGTSIEGIRLCDELSSLITVASVLFNWIIGFLDRASATTLEVPGLYFSS